MATTDSLPTLHGNILVIGGTGFVGKHCLQYIQQNESNDIRLFTLNSHIPSEYKGIQGVLYLAGDLGDATAVEHAVKEAQPEIIIHFASPKPFIEADSVYERVNIQGTKNLLSACDKVGTTKTFVYCSSVSVIDNGSITKLHGDETWPVLFAPEQKEYYWHSKAMAETLILAHNGKNGMLTTALRVTSIFGEDDEQIIGGMIQQAKSGALKTQLGDGKNRGDWTYVGNVVDAHLHAAKCLLREREANSPPADDMSVGGEAFYITNDDPRPFWDFARQVGAAAGFPVEESEVTKMPAFMAWVFGYLSEWALFVTSFGARKAALSRKTLRYAVVEQVFSMVKAKKRMGWKPKVGIEEAIEQSVASFIR